MITFCIHAEHVPNLGAKPLSNHEKRKYLSSFFMPGERIAEIHPSGDSLQFEFRLATMERAADFLGILYLQNRTSVLIPISNDERKIDLLAKIITLPESDYFLITIRNEHPWSVGDYIGISKEHALKFKLQF